MALYKLRTTTYKIHIVSQSVPTNFSISILGYISEDQVESWKQLRTNFFPLWQLKYTLTPSLSAEIIHTGIVRKLMYEFKTKPSKFSFPFFFLLQKTFFTFLLLHITTENITNVYQEKCNSKRKNKAKAGTRLTAYDSLTSLQRQDVITMAKVPIFKFIFIRGSDRNTAIRNES